MHPLELLEKWAEETRIENITWHELSLLKSFASWLEISGLTQRAPDAARRCPACNAMLEETSVYCDNCGTDTPRR